MCLISTKSVLNLTLHRTNWLVVVTLRVCQMGIEEEANVRPSGLMQQVYVCHHLLSATKSRHHTIKPQQGNPISTKKLERWKLFSFFKGCKFWSQLRTGFMELIFLDKQSSILIWNCIKIRKGDSRSTVAVVLLVNIFQDGKPKQASVKMWKLWGFPGPGAAKAGRNAYCPQFQDIARQYTE